ncbi:PREDICTED: myosin-7-like [Ipomoea nil]|uniref:myosin-7-like n=1 Tax=Ipomoea nil TaxID=35883 RepID=UPI000900D8D9|nr:PREDICTED: myosin-7-like [Ipomoea nil]
MVNIHFCVDLINKSQEEVCPKVLVQWRTITVYLGLESILLLERNMLMQYVGSSWDDLKHVRQAVGFLVLQEKAKITYDDLTTDLCPVVAML